MREFVYYNDTGREVNIHSGNHEKVVLSDKSPIQTDEMRTFRYPDELTPIIKMWDYGESGLQILVTLVER